MAYQSINSLTEELLESFAQHSDAELDSVLRVGDATFRTEWRSGSYEDRAAILKTAVATLRRKKDHHAEIATR